MGVVRTDPEAVRWLAGDGAYA